MMKSLQEFLRHQVVQDFLINLGDHVRQENREDLEFQQRLDYPFRLRFRLYQEDLGVHYLRVFL